LREFFVTPTFVEQVVVDVDLGVVAAKGACVFKEVTVRGSLPAQFVESIVLDGYRECRVEVGGTIPWHVEELVAMEVFHDIVFEYEIIAFISIVVAQLNERLSMRAGFTVPAHVVEQILFEYQQFTDCLCRVIGPENPLVVKIFESTVGNQEFLHDRVVGSEGKWLVIFVLKPGKQRVATIP